MMGAFLCTAQAAIQRYYQNLGCWRLGVAEYCLKPNGRVTGWWDLWEWRGYTCRGKDAASTYGLCPHSMSEISGVPYKAKLIIMQSGLLSQA